MADLATLEAQISTAIGQQETGQGTAGVGLSLNNPGAIKFADWETAYGATSTPGGFSSFPSLSNGTDALKALIDRYVQGGSSLSSLINTYAPASDGNTNNDARVSQLSALTGLNPAASILSQASQPAGTDTGSYLAGLGSALGMGTQTQAATVAASQATAANAQTAVVAASGIFSSVTWSRFAALVAGLICLVAGLMLLKQTQVLVQNVQQRVAKLAPVAEAAAVAV